MKYAVQAIDQGLNVVTSFRSLSLQRNEALLKLAKSRGVKIMEISPRLDVIHDIFGTSSQLHGNTP